MEQQERFCASISSWHLRQERRKTLDRARTRPQGHSFGYLRISPWARLTPNIPYTLVLLLDLTLFHEGIVGLFFFFLVFGCVELFSPRWNKSVKTPTLRLIPSSNNFWLQLVGSSIISPKIPSGRSGMSGTQQLPAMFSTLRVFLYFLLTRFPALLKVFSYCPGDDLADNPTRFISPSHPRRTAANPLANIHGSVRGLHCPTLGVPNRHRDTQDNPEFMEGSPRRQIDLDGISVETSRKSITADIVRILPKSDRLVIFIFWFYSFLIII